MYSRVVRASMRTFSSETPVGQLRVAQQAHRLARPLPRPPGGRVDQTPRVLRPSLHAFVRRRVVGEVLDQIIGMVGRGVLEQVRAQGVRVLVAGNVDEGERLGGAAQRHAKLVDGGSVLLLPQCPRCACRHFQQVSFAQRRHPARAAAARLGDLPMVPPSLRRHDAAPTKS